MADTTDELAQLMPRTKAANERANVNMDNLKEYIAAAQHDPSLSVPQRTSVMIRTDVRKDAEGFEDIDDFWADDDVAGDKDDTEGEDSMLSEVGTSSANVSMVSEMEVNMSGLDVASSDESDHLRGRYARGDSVTMELESQTSQRGSDEHESAARSKAQTQPRKSSKTQEDTTASTARQKRDEQPQKMHTPPKARSRSPRPLPAFEEDDVDFSFGDGGSPPPSVRESSPRGLATPAKSKKNSEKQASPALSSKSAQKRKLRRESNDSFGGDMGGFDDVASPFSIHDAVLTPLSNASEKNLLSIKPFSENSPTDSPNIQVQLFKPKKKNAAEAWDGDTNITKRAKKNKPAATKAKDSSGPKTKARKYTYKSTSASEVSFEEQLTDNDDGSFLATSGIASDENDSDYDLDKSINLSRVRNGREGDLSFADEILKDARRSDNGELRRSNRTRYKPLAWYKGEHYVYERRQSGVGLVIPTVAAIERAGTTTPMKKSRPVVKKTTRATRIEKPLPRDKLPKGLKITDGEWADLWDISANTINTMNVLCRSEEVEHRELPAVDDLPPGTAGQSFNLRNPTPFSRWISGSLGLPPGAAKEAESVGDAVQVFFVTAGQPQALEVAFGPAEDGVFDPKIASRFILKPGDEFYIPAQNAYYLKNHSTTSASELHFMILKPDTRSRSPSVTPSRQSEGEDASTTTPANRKQRKRSTS